MTLTPMPPFRRPPVWPDFVATLAAHVPDPTRLYLVGGVVRDALYRRPIHDYDLATPDDGLSIARQLADALGGHYYPVDPLRRTGRIIFPMPEGTVTVDVASFRGVDLYADLEGRDFTINAMAAPLSRPEEVIDPLGGQDDLFVHKVLRQCTPSSIPSDPIRALRAVRQARQFGLRIEAATLAAVRAAGPQLLDEQGALRQPERARDELFKTLAGAHPAGALRLLHMLGLWRALAPIMLADIGEVALAVVDRLGELFAIISPQRDDNTAADLTLGVAVMVLDRYRRQLQDYLGQTFGDGRPITALLTLGALTPPDCPDPAPLWAERLRLSNAERKILSALHATRPFLADRRPLDDRGKHSYYRTVGETGIAGVLLMMAEVLAAHRPLPDPLEWGRLLEEVAAPLLDAFFRRHQQIVAPPLLVDGDDLVRALGVSPGPRIGYLLDQLLEAQAAGEICTKQEALRLAERLLRGSRLGG